MLNGVHHVTYVVEDVSKIVSFMQKYFDLKPTSMTENPKRGLKMAFYHIGPTIVDFFQPVREDADFAKFLREKGPGIVHVGWQVDNIDKVADDLAARGAKPRTRRATMSPNGYKTLSIDPPNAHGIMVHLAEGEMTH